MYCIKIKHTLLNPNYFTSYTPQAGVLQTGKVITIACDEGFERVDVNEVVTCVTKDMYLPTNIQGCQGNNKLYILTNVKMLYELCLLYNSKFNSIFSFLCFHLTS